MLGHEMHEVIRRRNEDRPWFPLEPGKHIQEGALHVGRPGDENFVAVPGGAHGLQRIEHDDDGRDASRVQASDRPQANDIRAENDRPRPTRRVIHVARDRSRPDG